jgi:hypothetical protein
LRLDKDGGSWIRTPLPQAAESRVERKAELKLDESGNLEGKLIVTYSGLEALWRRIDELDDDEAARKKFLEDEVKAAVPVPAEVELTKAPDWKSSSPAMSAEFNLKVSGWASGAGRRELVPVGLFSESEKHTFEHSKRTFPIYFHFPFEAVDEVSVRLPDGWQVSGLPPAQDTGPRSCSYHLKVENLNGNIHWMRQLTVDGVLFKLEYYTALRNFFQMVRSGDGQQVVVGPN